MQKIYRLLSALSLLLALSNTVLAQTQPQTTQTFGAGSLIIDMGVVPQTIGNGLRPYGLLYRLLEAKVPVAWSIRPGKLKDEVDFSIGSRQFRGGPFIVDVRYRTPEINAIITNFQGQGVVTFTTTAPLTVPVYIQAFNQPKWTMDRQNGSIAQAFFTNAGIPASAYGGTNRSAWKLPSELDCCDDIFVMPHADPVWNTHRRLVSWNMECKGAIWLGCHAGSALELMWANIPTADQNPGGIDRDLQANFNANKTGPAQGTGVWSTPNNTLTIWGNHGNGTPPYSYDHHDDPVMQFLGIIDPATQNGSEQIYIPRSAGWRSSTKVGVYDPDHPQRVGTPTNPGVYQDALHRAAVLAYGRGYGDEERGFVMLEASHNIAGSSPANVAAQRAFFNFSFLSAAEKAAVPILNGLPSGPLFSGQEYPLSVSFIDGKDPAEPFQVVWTSSCGGTFLPNATSPNARFIPPTAASATTCLVTATITDACGRVTFDTEAVTVQCNFQVTPSVSNSCFNSPNGGEITYNFSGISGTGTPSYSWTKTGGSGPTSGSGSGTTIPGLSAGTYTVTVTAPNGCIATFTSTVSLSPEIIVSATTTQVSCNGGTNGAINVSVSGGTPGYTYNWDDGITTANRTGLAAGTYTLSVTDSRGCERITSYTINQPVAITMTPTITDVTCFGESNGIINLSVSGGVPGVEPAAVYTFLWNDGNTSQNRNGLAPGSYSVTVTDANSCTASFTDLVITQPENALSLSAEQVNVACFGLSTGSIDLVVVGGTAPYTYAWTRTGGGFSAISEDISDLTAGAYNVVVTDANGCVANLAVTLTQPTALALSTAFSHPTCPPDAEENGFDGSVELTVTGGTAPYTYVWTATPASITGVVPAGQVNNEDLAGIQHGTYSVTVTDSNGCEATTSVTLVAQNPKPVSPPVIKD